MKKSLLASTLILLLSVSPCFAISFSISFVEQGDSVAINIGLTDVPEPLITAGFIMEYDPLQMSIVSADINEGSWDKGMSNIVKDPQGQPPGTVIFTAGNLSLANPDENSNIGVASVQFQCPSGSCSGQTVTIDTVPGFDSVVGSSSGVFDSQIAPYTFSITTSTTSTTTTKDYICVPEAIYGQYSKETELLRSLRDNVLRKTPEGRELIKLYYQWSPIIVQAMEADEEFKQEVKDMVDEVLGVME